MAKSTFFENLNLNVPNNQQRQKLLKTSPRKAFSCVTNRLASPTSRTRTDAPRDTQQISPGKFRHKLFTEVMCYFLLLISTIDVARILTCPFETGGTHFASRGATAAVPEVYVAVSGQSQAIPGYLYHVSCHFLYKAPPKKVLILSCLFRLGCKFSFCTKCLCSPHPNTPCRSSVGSVK